jgi:hypothetical protein
MKNTENKDKKKMNYQNGKLYKIISDHTNNNYIGSTCCPRLCDRLAQHKIMYRKYLQTNQHYLTSFDILKFGDAKIILIENWPCTVKEELLKKERYWIENTPNCINKKIPGRTLKEYNEECKEKITIRKKLYFHHNKQKILANNNKYKKAKTICECGCEITKGIQFNHIKTKKHLKLLSEKANA